MFGGVLPYFEVTGHPVPVSSLGFKCPDCFIWNCSYIVYPAKMKGPFRDNCKVLLSMIGVPDGGMGGRHSKSTSPRSSSHSKDRHRAGFLRRSPARSCDHRYSVSAY